MRESFRQPPASATQPDDAAPSAPSRTNTSSEGCYPKRLRRVKPSLPESASDLQTAISARRTPGKSELLAKFHSSPSTQTCQQSSPQLATWSQYLRPERRSPGCRHTGTGSPSFGYIHPHAQAKKPERYDQGRRSPAKPTTLAVASEMTLPFSEFRLTANEPSACPEFRKSLVSKAAFELDGRTSRWNGSAV